MSVSTTPHDTKTQTTVILNLRERSGVARICPHKRGETKNVHTYLYAAQDSMNLMYHLYECNTTVPS